MVHVLLSENMFSLFVQLTEVFLRSVSLCVSILSNGYILVNDGFGITRL